MVRVTDRPKSSFNLEEKHGPSSGPLVFIKHNSGKVTFMLEQSRFLVLMSEERQKRKIVLI